MNRHLMRGLLALYPPTFRDRYGTELASLTDELVRAGELTPLLAALNLLGGAALEWGRVLAYSRHAAQAMTVAAIMAVAGSLFLIGHAPPQTTPVGANKASAPVFSAGCALSAKAAGALAKVPWIKADLGAAAKSGQFIWIEVPVKVFSVGTRKGPVSVGNSLARPRPAASCVIWLNPAPGRFTVSKPAS
jgi:hypothetical protein